MTEDSIVVDENSILLHNRELIILKVGVEYWEKNHEDKIRYINLKKLSNESLSKLTDGKETDFGGNFERLIKRLDERLDDDEHPNKNYLKRDKQSRKKTIIIFDIERIRDLLASKGLYDSNQVDISSYFPFGERVGDTPKHYYGYYRISNPSDRIQVFRNWIHFAKELKVYSSKLWNISLWREDESFVLQDKEIQNILQLGTKIASANNQRPFKIILEYRGEPISMTYAEAEQFETFTQSIN